MFRFTIRDVLWLTVVVGMACGWLLTAQRAALLDARLRSAELRAKELRGEVILPANPDIQLKTLEGRGWERPRAKDE